MNLRESLKSTMKKKFINKELINAKMFDVIIPIRSKSKGLKNKNILPFLGKTILVNYTIKKLINIKK